MQKPFGVGLFSLGPKDFTFCLSQVDHLDLDEAERVRKDSEGFCGFFFDDKSEFKIRNRGTSLLKPWSLGQGRPI